MPTAALPRPMTVEDLLDQAVEACQPTQTQHERALRSYQHVGSWVCDPEGSLATYSPRFSPHGSFIYGTVVPPRWGHEFDLDALARLLIDPYRVYSDDAHTWVANRLSEHADLHERMEILPRCVRLHYAGDFHNDVAASCDHPQPGRGILVRAKPEERADDSPWSSWKLNDPFGFARWFDERNAVLSESRGFSAVDPAPPYLPASRKTPLRKIVQLTKMRRNAFYEPDDAPPSIMITAMAGQCYRGQTFTLQTHIEVIEGMLAWVEREGDLLVVPHPTLHGEDLAKGLDKKARARFREFLGKYLAELNALGSRSGLHHVSEEMRKMYPGPAVDAAVRSLAESVQNARARDALHVGRVGAPLIIVADKTVAANIMPRPNPSHTFDGGPLEQ